MQDCFPKCSCHFTFLSAIYEGHIFLPLDDTYYGLVIWLKLSWYREKQHFMFFLICIFLITNDVNHLFMHLLGICSLTSVYVLLRSKIAFSTIYFMKYFTGLFIPLHPVFCSFLILLASYIYR